MGSHERGGARPELLVVEDDFDCRELLGIFLETVGYDVVLAAGSDDAMRALAAHAFSVIITDYSLGPSGDTGPALLERAAASGLKSSPAIIYTAFPTAAAAASLGAMQSATVRIVEKPRVAQLQREIERLLAAS